jgi:hypothetical protein
MVIVHFISLIESAMVPYSVSCRWFCSGAMLISQDQRAYTIKLGGADQSRVLHVAEKFHAAGLSLRCQFAAGSVGERVGVVGMVGVASARTPSSLWQGGWPARCAPAPRGGRGG